MKNLKYIAAGYLVEYGKVLLSFHEKQNQWVPAGGHVENNESFQSTLIRETKEELGLDVQVLDSIGDIPYGNFGRWSMEPRPFHCDIEKMDDTNYDHDLYVQMYYIRRKDKAQEPKVIEGIKEFKWFTKEEVKKLDTYEQVKALSLYALINHPDVKNE